MYDVNIGKTEWGTTAYLARDLNTPEKRCHISQNSVSYWIHGAYLGIDLRVAKDTKEAEKIKQLLSAQEADEKIHEYLEALVIEHAGSKLLKARIEDALDDAFNRGRRHQAGEVRRALMLA